ncbi:uncharacterized protein LOC131239104 [Magnolia sinica]|uniref:uncharacterized protein LOC131239104 n=1 Tax=Magnolia sinica TaxID=86752 RepID=UPI00265A9BD5|nr:uncharacterized protein LOC131239104 [Magnolia sinica]
MGLNHNLGLWAFLFFFFLVLLISSLPSPAMSHQIRANANAPSHLSRRFQVYKIKNTTPYLLDEDLNKNSNRRKRRKKKKIKPFETRTFSAMLPKGFVPPSGSSPCHNDMPDSINFYCDYSTTNP